MKSKAKYIIIMAFLLIFNSACSVLEEGPMPYSSEAIEKFKSAVDTVKAPPAEPGMSGEEKLKLGLKILRKYFSAAGYSFDKTVVKVANDIQKDPQFFNTNEYAGLVLYFTQGYCAVIISASEENKVPLEKVVSADVAKAIYELTGRGEKAEKK